MNDKEVIDYIKKNFVYNNDGTFTRLDRKNSKGSYDKDGYLIIKIKGKQYKAHRLVFAYFNNRFPKDEIDHLNRIRDDNRIENLRECNRTENVNNTELKTLGVYIDNTKGLKKKYAFHYKNKTYRTYKLNEAIKLKLSLGGKINERLLKTIGYTDGIESPKKST